MRPEDLPAAPVLAQRKHHGHRVRYVGGCRCMLCRAANSRYETERAAARRAGDWNGIVMAGRARRHLRKLSRAGIGRRSVSEACDACETTIAEISAGTKKRIRARTERKILGVTYDAVAGGGLVSAGRTWKLIGRLLEEGFSKAELARRLGYSRPALQLNRVRVTARNAVRVERFYRRLMEGA